MDTETPEELHELNEYSDPEFNESDTSETPPNDIVAFNELRSCADLARMTEDGVIDLQPDFQRDVVWTSADQTRFIDSLVKQLPIPSMCFAFDHTKDKWIVIDGLQRMTCVVKFLKGGDWKLSRLEDIDQRLSGKIAAKFKTGRGDEKKIFDRVQNKTLPITVLRCEFGKRSHMEYLFTVFHRLNAGGAKLNNQEIRNCIFSGSFNNLLKELDNLPNWRKFNIMKEGANYRFLKQEVILRIFAFAEESDSYTGQIGKFLNDYMHPRRKIGEVEIERRREQFRRSVDVVDRIFPDGPAERLPTAVVEALFVGIIRNLDALEALPGDDLVARFNALRAAGPFSEEGLAEGLSKRDKVTARLNAALDIFS
ncbi:MAG: DUF262 domain-containing protein [Boseongicola sp. SB0677_bin_26]|nr:DUF262 domain-containing protein [Boseongicola sp. SB0665_bin_10]MYG24819.1 DUF262 domain-containing protein [Boseongicola sp. SB0677_bin_26]